MKITLLGTGSPIPDPNRAGPSTLVQEGSTALLFDAGRGVVTRLAAAGLFPAQLSAVVLTHLHSDHVSDLNDVVTTHWIMSGPDAVLRIIGPVGTSALVDTLLQMLGADVGYRLAHHDDLHSPPRVEVTEVRPGAQLELGELSVLVGATDHRPVEPSLGFRVSSAQQSVVIAGDGVPCESLDDLVRGADAYVQTVVRDDLVRLVPVPRLHDILDYHSTVAQAADTARRAGVRVLVLTHYVPAPPVGEEHAWAASARECFDGEIVAGPDLTSVDLS